MEYSTILLERRDRIATITLNRPAKLNAMSRQLICDLEDAFKRVEQDEQVRSIILTGAGRAFCAGGDVSEMTNFQEQSALFKYDWVRKADLLMHQIWRLTKPTVAAINGVAIGGGCCLTLACDIRIASSQARMGVGFIKRGLSGADMALTWFLPRIVGQGWANQLILTGDVIEAQLAERINLVNQVVTQDKLMDEAVLLAKKLAEGPPAGIAMTKRALDVASRSDLLTTIEYENAIQTLCLFTEDFKEGNRAFAEKREPAYTGE